MTPAQTLRRLERCRADLIIYADEALIRKTKCETASAEAFEAGMACGFKMAENMVSREIRELKRGMEA